MSGIYDKQCTVSNGLRCSRWSTAINPLPSWPERYDRQEVCRREMEAAALTRSGWGTGSGLDAPLLYSDDAEIAKERQKLSTPREIVTRQFPWKGLDLDAQMSSLYLRLCDHGEFIATGGRGMHRDALAGLPAFYATLADKVIVNATEGLALRDRELADADHLVRIDGGLNREQERIWRLPGSSIIDELNKLLGD